MVPTTVERLREGQGVLERVLRSIKMERNYKRNDGSAEKESGMKTIWISKHTAIYVNDSMFLSVLESRILSVFADTDRYEVQAVSMASPMKSPHRYSPSVYSHQVFWTSIICSPNTSVQTVCL